MKKNDKMLVLSTNTFDRTDCIQNSKNGKCHYYNISKTGYDSKYPNH